MTRASFRRGAKLDRIGNRLDDPTPILKQIGAIVAAQSRRAFKAQSFDGERWKPRGEVNVFGLLADFSQGAAKPKTRRFDRRPALVDTGRLRSSIAWKVQGKTVVIGSNLSYAAKHQTGGESESEKITPQMQKSIGKWLKRQPEEMKTRLSFLISPEMTNERLRMRLPERRFVGITEETRKFVRKAVGVELLDMRKHSRGLRDGKI